MAFSGTGKVWMNGKIVDWADANIHIASHVIHYGSAVFEGARCYKTPKGSAFFRLDAHMRRLYDSARIYRMDYDVDLRGADAGRHRHGHRQRPRGVLHPPAHLPRLPHARRQSAALPGRSGDPGLGVGRLSRRRSAREGRGRRVSSWTRSAPNTFPAMAKTVANYANSGLIKMEAVLDGYSEGIALDPDGLLSEGSGQNLFLVRDERALHAAARRVGAAGHHARHAS